MSRGNLSKAELIELAMATVKRERETDFIMTNDTVRALVEELERTYKIEDTARAVNDCVSEFEGDDLSACQESFESLYNVLAHNPRPTRHN